MLDELSREFQAATPKRIDGIVIGTLAELDDAGMPAVFFPGQPDGRSVAARSTAALSVENLGRQVALMFEAGDPARPIVLGVIQQPGELMNSRKVVEVERDGERLEITAAKEIVLRCGEASLTLTEAGKIILRGTYLLSRSSGVNRIKGGSVQIN
jgi:hypothetical protein